MASLIFAACNFAVAEDWPMWRNNPGRTNQTPEQIPAQLNLLWKRELPPVKPAFQKERLQFDQGYEPIVAGNMIFVALPHIDAVTAYAADTGAEQWVFYTDGPVRLAPVAWEGFVYFGSDDGHLYCLNGADGTLQWKFCAVPSKRKILGNGRLISVWPLRGGPVIADGKVYFAAGVWPLEGVFVYALDAKSGTTMWVNDRAGSLYGKTPHSGEGIAGLSPQGYLLIAGGKLVVPCGTARPATFNLDTGELIEFSLPEERNIPGGWFMAENTQEAKDIRRGKLQFDSTINQDRHEDKSHTGEGIPGHRSHIMLGGQSLHYADGIEGVHGNIHSMLVANGRLFVVTLEGTLYAFGPEAVTPILHQKIIQNQTSDTTLPPSVSTLLESTKLRNGCALVLGTTDGVLAQQLVAHTEFKVLAFVPTETNTERLRKQFAAAGVQNDRLTFLTGSLLDQELPPYLADFIFVMDWHTTRHDAVSGYLSTVYERLRPYGGVTCLAVAPDEDDRIRTWFKDAGHSQAEIKRVGDFLIIRRAGPLPGTVDYVNDWSAPDDLVRAPLGILWFDDAISHFKRSPQPEFRDGVMISRHKDWRGDPHRFSSSPNEFHEVGTGRFNLLEGNRYTDVYTGRVMSQEEAEVRLTFRPNEPDVKQRPPYQYRPPFVKTYYEDLVAKGSSVPKWPFQRNLDRGEMVNPITGLKEPRRYVKSYGCDGGNDYGHLITMRSATPAFYDKRLESGTINISGPRSGCTNSIIPANGVLNLPYFYDGCTCSYPLPTGAALVSMPQSFEQWTAWGPGEIGPMIRIGINLGAPGDRMTNEGTLFVDHPSVGGPSPEVAVKTIPESPEYFYRHALFAEGGKGWPWVCASGAKGLTSLRLTGLKGGTFTVRLYFIEPEHTSVGARRFDVTIQGETLLADFDIFADTGGRMRCTVNEFDGIRIDGTCDVTLSAVAGVPLLSGIELVSSGLPLDNIITLSP